MASKSGYIDSLGNVQIVVSPIIPANVISTTLTVDNNDCIEPCTINGTVGWTNPNNNC